jgi:hypothetical protein
MFHMEAVFLSVLTVPARRIWRAGAATCVQFRSNSLTCQQLYQYCQYNDTSATLINSDTSLMNIDRSMCREDNR